MVGREQAVGIMNYMLMAIVEIDAKPKKYRGSYMDVVTRLTYLYAGRRLYKRKDIRAMVEWFVPLLESRMLHMLEEEEIDSDEE